jgi:hypothetical protein
VSFAPARAAALCQPSEGGTPLDKNSYGELCSAPNAPHVPLSPPIAPLQYAHILVSSQFKLSRQDFGGSVHVSTVRAPTCLVGVAKATTTKARQARTNRFVFRFPEGWQEWAVERFAPLAKALSRILLAKGRSGQK